MKTVKFYSHVIFAALAVLLCLTLVVTSFQFILI